jgi:hypothetical protein
MARILRPIQCVRMKGIQNKIMIYINLWVPLHHYKGKLSKFLSQYITFSINFNVGSLGCMTNIQRLFELVPRVAKTDWCYCSHSVPYAGLQVLKIVDLNPLDNVLHMTPQEKKTLGLNLAT